MDGIADIAQRDRADIGPLGFAVALEPGAERYDNGFEIGVDEIDHDGIVAPEGLADHEGLALSPLGAGGIGDTGCLDVSAEDLQHRQAPGSDFDGCPAIALAPDAAARMGWSGDQEAGGKRQPGCLRQRYRQQP